MNKSRKKPGRKPMKIRPVRADVLLFEDQVKKLDQLARMEGVTRSNLLRTIVDGGLRTWEEMYTVLEKGSGGGLSWPPTYADVEKAARKGKPYWEEEFEEISEERAEMEKIEKIDKKLEKRGKVVEGVEQEF